MGFAQRKDVAPVGVEGAARTLLPVDGLVPNPEQPRKEIDETSPEFGELVESIRRHGLIHPVAVIATATGYMLVAGERRWRAFRRLAAEEPRVWGQIPVTVLPTPPGDVATAALILGLLENVVRSDLRPGDRAAAVARLKETTGWTYEAIADHLGLSRARVIDMAAIAQQPAVVEALNAGRLTQKEAAKVARQVPAGAADSAGDLIGLMETAKASTGTRTVWDPSTEKAAAAPPTDEPMVHLVDTPLRDVKPRVTQLSPAAYAALVRTLHRTLKDVLQDVA